MVHNYYSQNSITLKLADCGRNWFFTFQICTKFAQDGQTFR